MAEVIDAFAPFSLGALRLRNRILKAATFEGMCPGGAPSDALIDHHRAVAAGGAAMTTVAYCAVSHGGRSYDTQMWLRPEIVPALARLTGVVHAEGAAAMLQLGHSGDFANPRVIGARPMGPSRRFVTYNLSFCRAMSEDEIARVVDDFARAARLAAEAGFDAVELHFGHGYLVSQFLSPYTNRRRDRWGGAIGNRARLAVEIVRAVRASAKIAVLAKVNLRDGFAGGLEIEEAIAIARMLEVEGVDGLVLSGGFVTRAPLYMLRGEVPLAQMVAVQKRAIAKLGLSLFGRLFVKEYPYAEAFFLDEARRMRRAVTLPLVLLGGIKTRAAIERAMAEGFEMVGMARALIHDPALVKKMASGEIDRSACVPCNQCIAEMDRGGVRCTRS